MDCDAHAVAGSGHVRMVGPILFDEASFDAVLRSQLSRVARDAVFDVCSQTTRVSKLRLRRAIVKAAEFGNGIILKDPGPITTREVTGYGNVEATCAVPFTGDPQLFLFSTPARPTCRGVRGKVEKNALRLDAEAGSTFIEWLPTLFAAEIEMIAQHLRAQAEVVRQYHDNLNVQAQALVDRIYPALLPASLRDIDNQASFYPEFQQYMRDKLWKRLFTTRS